MTRRHEPPAADPRDPEAAHQTHDRPTRDVVPFANAPVTEASAGLETAAFAAALLLPELTGMLRNALPADAAASSPR